MNQDLFNLSGHVVIITGGAGLLGRQHAEAVLKYKGTPILLDVAESVESLAKELKEKYQQECVGYLADILSEKQLVEVRETILERFGRIDALINNAARDPKVEKNGAINFSRLEHFPIEQWQKDFDIGVTGAFLCSRVFGQQFVKQRKGVILNIASDLAVIAPDQRLYRNEELPENEQPVKPVSYSVVKTALLGLTRYLSTYWAEQGIRVNAISPGGVYNHQPDGFVARLNKLIPMHRMANVDEYQGAIVFLLSDASSYMTGQNLVLDGGRSAW